MRRNGARWAATGAEVLLLAAAVGFLASVVVRSHWTSIWMDREFTGWVAPVANRLADGVRLYGPEAHLPMPPLPFLVTYAVAPGRATWLTESALIVACQSALTLALYFGLAGRLPRPIPLVAALLSAPLYFALPKTILYDASTQLLVALAALAAAWASERLGHAPPAGGSRRSPARRFVVLAPAALLAALTLFSKQSTGTGLVLGVAALLALAGPGRRLPARAADAAAFVLLAALFLVGLAAACQAYLSVPGMFHDVFLAGAEPKGGSRAALKNTIKFVRWIIENVSLYLVYGVTFAALVARRGRDPEPVEAPAEPAPLPPRATALAYAAVVAAPVLLGIFRLPPPRHFTRVAHLLSVIRVGVLWAGLFFVLLSYLRGRFRPEPGRDRGGMAWLEALAPVLFLAAFFHSMSVVEFRWYYDNNPIVTVAVAGFLYGLSALLLRPGRRVGGRTTAAYVAVLFVVSGAFWAGFLKQYTAARKCTEEWAEVRHLRGARLPKTAEGMRRLVATVRRCAPDAASDDVLLLPNDPNVEAWFERRRPALSGAIVFTDQYWDRYVEQDFRRLSGAPPKVIIIGPRSYWRRFEMWGKNRGSARLIELVQTRLLPDRYTYESSQAIHHMDGEDYMDIYVRKDEGRLTSRPPAATAVRR